MALALGLLLAAAGLTGCRNPPTTLTVTNHVGGLDKPWDLAFLPDGTLIFTEKSGRVKKWDGTTASQLVLPGDVISAGEAGMMGLAVDPSYNTNRFVYTCYATSADVRVVKWTMNPDTTALVSPTPIVTGITKNSSGRHSGCRTRFGPDGYLYVGTGDAAIGTTPQNPASLAGKTLRVDRDGNPAPGNIGVIDPSSPLDDRIFTYGHRNVQGIAFRPDGQAFSVEHGTDCDDEVNFLVAGTNYGWDPSVAGNPNGYQESGRPMTDLTKFPNAKPAVWSSGCPTIAPSGGTFLTGAQWSGWDGALAMAVLKGSQVRVLFIDGEQTNGNWTAITDQGRLRSAVQGPDGNLYIATDQAAPNGRILKVVPTP